MHKAYLAELARPACRWSAGGRCRAEQSRPKRSAAMRAFLGDDIVIKPAIRRRALDDPRPAATRTRDDIRIWQAR